MTEKKSPEAERAQTAKAIETFGALAGRLDVEQAAASRLTGFEPLVPSS
jgi:hypothetical protein